MTTVHIAPPGRSVPATRDEVLAAAHRARTAAAGLAVLSRSDKDAALTAMAAALRSRMPDVLAANEIDVAAAIEAGSPAAMVDRLRLTSARVQAMTDGLLELVALPDPVGTVVRGNVLANGVQLTQLRVPLGVVAIIYEARPNVTVDAAGLIALKSGQRGSAARQRRPPDSRPTGRSCDVLTGAGVAAGLPAAAVQLVPGTSTASRCKHLMRARGLVDVLIPRGGADLIQYRRARSSTVPVIETGVGNCHVYVDAGRRPRAMALDDPAQRQDPAAVASATRPRPCSVHSRRDRRVPAFWRCVALR